MNENLQAVRDDVIRGLGELTGFFGFSPVMGRLYGALLMSPTPLSLDEMEEIVDKSKASVSMNMRSLERWGMVREVWVKGDRRKYYEAETDIWRIVAYVLESRERREVQVALDVLDNSSKQLEESKPELSEEDQELAEYYLDRVKDMQDFFRFAQLAIDILLTRGAPPKIEDVNAIYKNNHEEAAD